MAKFDYSSFLCPYCKTGPIKPVVDVRFVKASREDGEYYEEHWLQVFEHNEQCGKRWTYMVYPEEEKT